MNTKLLLQDGTEFLGTSFGAPHSVSGEVVFSTGMVGYPESLTDPSFKGQILVLTYPLVGNYGVPDPVYWESEKIQISGLIVSQYIDTPSHFESKRTLSQWLKDEQIPAIEMKDTRFLAQKIRNDGSPLGKILISDHISFHDPNKDNLVAQVSAKEVKKEGKGNKTIVLIDCGSKENIKRNLLRRGLQVITVPWDYDVFASDFKFDAILISNGPGDPKMADKTIETAKKALEHKVPTMGICLGNQILSLAAGGDTFKLKFGHRGQNQPVVLEGSKKCFLTTQNHGFAIGEMPDGFKPWFTNGNDGTNEGIIHTKYPFMSVQFHPEAMCGPFDTEWIFDYFIERL
ncbi:glutamine-hydrolyzing carbamoyl-phosphate synthase small subunit [Candidatus Roizmanbacteria bacterium]|nr:glutamine-hydrolyzing carbamoyl-phosphate synthase small subunit [Candidatus Roizmanbacteria bacterium]